MTGLLAIFISNEHVHAQQRFRATPIVKINWQPTWVNESTTYGSMGINNKGQVVYAYKPTPGDSLRAFIWLPANDGAYVTPFNSAGFHELPATGAPAPSIARDLNESGDVVGQSGMDSPFGALEGQATIWRLSQSTTPITLGNFGGTVYTYSGAHGVSDHDPPIVVGEATKTDQCNCPQSGPLDDTVFRGFYAVLSGGSPSLVELTEGGRANSLARDVAVPSGNPTGYYIVGDIHCDGPGEECRTTDPCEGSYDPVRWGSSTSPSAMVKLEMIRGGYARAVSKYGFAVGSSRLFSPCIRHANFWASPGTLTDLGETMPSGQEIDASRAEGMNDLENPQVVGWNEFNAHALLWEYTGFAWTVLDLQSTAAIGALGGSNPRFDLKEAHDINDSGWIATWGFCEFTETSLNGYYAVLLTPFPQCPADINSDGFVNVVDMLAVINAWGECQIGFICNADVTGDAHVNVTDLLALINAWGACGNPEEAPQSIEDCQSRCANYFGSSGSEYTDCVEKCIRALCETGALPPEDCPD